MGSAFLWIYTHPELAPVLEGLLGTHKGLSCTLLAAPGLFPSIFSSSTAPSLSRRAAASWVGMGLGPGAQKQLHIPRKEGTDPPLSWFKDVTRLFITSSLRAPGPSTFPPADPQGKAGILREKQGSARDESNAPSQAQG